MLAACSKGSAGGSWRWQAVGNPGSSTPSRTYVHNDPLLDSRVWGPATHCQPPPPSLPSPWEERATPGRTQWGLYQTAHQSLIKKLGIFLGLSRFDSYKESVTMPSLVFKCRRWNAPFRSAKRALCQGARKLKTEHFHVKKQQKHCDTFKGYRCLVIWARSIDNRM